MYLDQARFEELPRLYKLTPKDAYHEFTRRLQPLVLQAAQARSLRLGTGLSQTDPDGLTIRAFKEFAPTFGIGEDALVLCRFAEVIRRVMDDAAFDAISRRYYMQLPIYHLADPHQRAFLAIAYQLFVGRPDMVERLSERFGISAERAADQLRSCNAALEKSARADFKIGELHRLTGGSIIL